MNRHPFSLSKPGARSLSRVEDINKEVVNDVSSKLNSVVKEVAVLDRTSNMQC
jgi:hypothetical protein